MKKHRFVIVFAVSILCFTISALATPKGVTRHIGPDSRLLAAVWGWTTEPWTGDDQQYKKIRDEVWHRMEGEKDTADLVRQYGALAKKVPYHPPYDPEAQFRWAYTVYQAALANPQYRDSSDFGSASQALGYGPSPQTYQYTRLRFLMDAMNWPDNHLVSVGKRLLQHTPDDYQVKYQLAHILASTASAGDKKLALKYAQELVRSKPDQAVYHSLVSEVYFTTWLISKSRSDGDNAISAYKKYLSLAPQSDVFRSQAQYLITKIQKTIQGK
jgi:predicted Zn-dependent protease